MPGTVAALGILPILLPGLLCAYVVQLLAVRRVQTEVGKAVEALIFSFLLSLVTLPFFGYVLPVSWHEIAPATHSYQIAARSGQLVLLASAAVVLGVLYAASINHDWLLRFFAFCGLLSEPRAAPSGTTF